MSVDSIPIWLVFVSTVVIVLASIYVGWRLGGRSRRKSEDEKEASVSGVSAAVLGLTAFMLVFTFSIVTARYDARRALVREDANTIRTTYLRADFLPEPDRTETKRLIRRHLELRLSFVRSNDPESIDAVQVETDRIQRRLWDLAVSNAERDMNSDVAALYIEALNSMFEIHASRVAIGLQARIPISLWLILFTLTVLGMISTGYHAGIVGSKWSRATVLLAVSFAMMTTLIASLDRPWGSRVTQQPLVDVQRFIAAEG